MSWAGEYAAYREALGDAPEGHGRRRDQRRECYHRARAELVAQLGGCCAFCGSAQLLQFDHLRPHAWRASRTARWVRLARYRREYARGLIQLLCKSCNARKGKPDGKIIPFAVCQGRAPVGAVAGRPGSGTLVDRVGSHAAEQGKDGGGEVPRRGMRRKDL